MGSTIPYIWDICRYFVTGANAKSMPLFCKAQNEKKEARSVAAAGESTLEENLREPPVYPQSMGSTIP
jgi:hypothetical protein